MPIVIFGDLIKNFYTSKKIFLFGDVVGEQKSGSGRVRGLLFGVGDQRFEDVPLGFSGFRGF